MEKPLVNKDYVLEKFPGKGGWTYAKIPEVLQNKSNPFGWVKVKGSVDGIEFKNYHLMPMGNGSLFLPVKAEIRKKIGKKEGDSVHVILFADNEALEIPEEFSLCLADEKAAETFFNKLSDSEKGKYLKWIYASKNKEVQIQRMAESINQLAQKKFFGIN